MKHLNMTESIAAMTKKYGDEVEKLLSIEDMTKKYRDEVEKLLSKVEGCPISVDQFALPEFFRLTYTKKDGKTIVHSFVDRKNGKIFHAESVSSPEGYSEGSVLI